VPSTGDLGRPMLERLRIGAVDFPDFITQTRRNHDKLLTQIQALASPKRAVGNFVTVRASKNRKIQ